MKIGDDIHGYQLIRPIGRGGFGEVWLAWSKTEKHHYAIKFLAAENPNVQERERSALEKFRSISSLGTASGIMPIQHAGDYEGRLFYVMPLADGFGPADPTNPDWEPLTLALKIREQKKADSWFKLEDIVSWMQRVLAALETFDQAGLVHRDLKPENILFLDGQPIVSDISLLTEDKVDLSQMGTYAYTPSSSYIEKGGKPDMYGFAATLYNLLTGNIPDKMGRPALRWPPKGESSLSAEERKAWLKLDAIILRSAEEKPNERYLTFQALSRDIGNSVKDSGIKPDNGKDADPRPTGKKYLLPIIGACVAVLVLIFIFLSMSRKSPQSEHQKYQAFAKKNMDNFIVDYAKAETIGTFVNTWDYGKVRDAMVKWLLPISPDDLDTAAKEIYGDQWKAGWDRLGNQKDPNTQMTWQSEVEENESNTPRTKPQDLP
jgi:serine/threonine protein kinase